jgi:hypothetical protein
MRIAQLIFVGSVAALAMLAAPALAKNSNAQKNEDTSASPACHARQQTADGSWVELPCEEVGAASQRQTQHKPAGRTSGGEAH